MPRTEEGTMAVLRRTIVTLTAASLLALVRAQPSPVVQERISAAIASAAADPNNVDYTSLVNVYIGTDNYGDVW